MRGAPLKFLLPVYIRPQRSQGNDSFKLTQYNRHAQIENEHGGIGVGIKLTINRSQLIIRADQQIGQRAGYGNI